MNPTLGVDASVAAAQAILALDKAARETGEAVRELKKVADIAGGLHPRSKESMAFASEKAADLFALAQSAYRLASAMSGEINSSKISNS